MANNDPMLKQLGRLRILYIILGVFLLADVLFIVIVSTVGHGKSSIPPSKFFFDYGFSIFSFLFMIVFLGWITRYYKKAQQQRTIAVQGGVPGPVAAEQPVAGSVPLTLPFTLRFHANWRYFLFLLILPMILTLVIGFVVVYFITFRATSHIASKYSIIFFAFFGVFSLLFLAIMGIALWFSARRLRHYIEISEGGIKGRFMGQENDLHWDEVKLFALWGGKAKAMHAYEVAGERGMVRWIVPVKNRWYCSIVSTLPFGEYHPQMQDVLALIAKKTDLPLRDLRLKWYGGEQK